MEPLAEPTSLDAGIKELGTFSRYATLLAERYRPQLTDAWEKDRFRTGGVPAIECVDGDARTCLRIARHLGSFRLLWRDVFCLADTPTVLEETSALADQLIAAALAEAQSQLTRFGQPRDEDGAPVEPTIFGLGKLGGGELNFSSDIDLVFAFTAAGKSDGTRSLSNEEYFIRLVRNVTDLLGTVTEHGQCYRVDLRLRPFGSAGRAALSFNAMEQYFQRDGRDWERYAWVKARPVAGGVAQGDRWLRSLRPFIYRRYLDYSIFDALRQMKRMIRAEIARQGLAGHIKLGRGGIREVEFIVQSMQLLRGGREEIMRSRSLLNALRGAATLGLIDEDDAKRLRAAYLFMRRLENRYQQVADAQEHEAPEEERVREGIALSLGADSWSSLEAQRDAHHREVAAQFEAVFAEDEEAKAQADRDAAWTGSDNAPRFDAFLASRDIRALGARAQRELEGLLNRLGAMNLEPETLEPVLELLARIAGRTTYLALLKEHDEVLDRLVALCRRSAWLASELTARPMLLDDLIDRRRPDDDIAVGELIERRLDACETGDIEGEMNVLREVMVSRRLSIARALLDKDLSAFACSEMLTALAEDVVITALALATRDIESRHGDFGDQGSFAIIGYGTLAARSLSFDSDLDLVFLFDAPSDAASSGHRPLEASVYYTRLVQRLLNYLTAMTGVGRLYEVDTRLRPNGRSGLLVSSFRGFVAYLREKAWTWELQALTRASAFAGTAALAKRFETRRRAIIRETRDLRALTRDVTEMRDKMRGEHPEKSRNDIRHGDGGRVDLDFLLQYARLRWGAEHPALAVHYSNTETIECLAAHGLLSADHAKALVVADESIREQLLLAALAGRNSTTLSESIALPIRELWSRWLGGKDAS